MYLQQQGIDLFSLACLEQHQAQLRYVLSLPIDSQSAYSLFAEVMQLTQKQMDCPQLVFEMACLIRPEHFGVLLGLVGHRDPMDSDPKYQKTPFWIKLIIRNEILVKNYVR